MDANYGKNVSAETVRKDIRRDGIDGRIARKKTIYKWSKSQEPIKLYNYYSTRKKIIKIRAKLFGIFSLPKMLNLLSSVKNLLKKDLPSFLYVFPNWIIIVIVYDIIVYCD